MADSHVGSQSQSTSVLPDRPGPGGQTVSCRGPSDSPCSSGEPSSRSHHARQTARLARRISRLISRIDQKIAGLLDAILHHPQFQELEARWRQLHYLVRSVPRGSNVRIRVLNVSWRELSRDFDRSSDFDSSQLFRKVYSEAFGTAGGQPFGLLIGDYRIRPWPSQEHPFSDISTLTAISEVAAASFSPFIATADPSLLGLDRWSELERSVDWAKVYEQSEFRKWNSFREGEDRQFVGLAIPPVLARAPYTATSPETHGLSYNENVTGPDASRMLWGNPAFSFAAVVIRSFADTEWLASIRGVTKHLTEEGRAEGVAEAGGLVTGLPPVYYDTDPLRVSPATPTEVTITDALEVVLSGLGFIPLTACRETEYCAFFSCRSLRKIPRTGPAWAIQNADVAARMHYVLCVSRFAHYLKIIARDLIGSYTDAESLEMYLNSWLRQYVTQDRDASPDVLARYPLREAVVRVREVPDRPGAYTSIVHLWPHCELDELRGAVTFRSELLSGSL
ncbi:type VI secretion system contractile sheath large subunit [Maioricimonas sp. JC845]|uniref:type VI secretion system contractile sheath large subunit n=1 Tax=Maioricimonas sp. JC845 TaxID=3232138 RepID=UPI00345A75D7